MRTRGIQLVLLAGLLGGCDRTPAPQAANVPPPKPGEAAPTTDPSAPDPAARPPAFIAIDGVQAQFPPAKLTLAAADGGRVSAELFSDDPPQTFRRDYSGNSFYLPMMLQIDSPARLGEAMWSMQKSDNDEADTAAGVFLENDRISLSPISVRVRFEPLDDRETVVLLSGIFRQTDRADPTQPPRDVKVIARLAAEVKISP